MDNGQSTFTALYQKANHNMKQLISTLLFSAVFFTLASAQPAETRKKQYNLDKSGLAIEGYDPVAYFTQGKAVEGKKDITLDYQGATYRFSTPVNREVFKNNPAKYEPQYGGWCAYAMGAKGEKVEIDPETFKIVDGKLYLFYNKFFNNTLKTWNKDEMHLKTNADISWMKFIQ
jgi:YHS domain-containing protein